MFKLPTTITLYGKALVPYALKAGMPKKKIKIIPTGINLNKSNNNDENIISIRKKFGINKDEVIILFVGLLVPRKGVDLVIRVANKIRGNVRFIIVGGGPNGKEFKKMAKSLGKRIIFTGFRQDVNNFYNEADVFFLPSRGEGLAGVIMESMKYGLPIVSSNIPCTPDLIVNNKTGFLCEPEDINCYIEKIKELINHKKLREKVGKKGREKIKEFGWDKVIKKYEELY